MDEPLAHSARPTAKPPIGPQTYLKHIEAVQRDAVLNAQRATAFYAGNREKFVRDVEAAAVWHDLGKLDLQNQVVLRQGSIMPLPVSHEDAGCANLKNLGLLESTVLVAAHHAGLFSRTQESGKQSLAFRNPHMAGRTDSELARYLEAHRGAKCPSVAGGEKEEIHRCGFTRRLALACLVDADHGDTARHYGGEVDLDYRPVRWAERLAALDTYVAGLPEGTADREKQRNELRRKVYWECRNAMTDRGLRCCDAPVGSGKTTAIMAHLLRVAQVQPNLRHIFVVLPFTNIIKQAVEVYRQALVLPGEVPEEIVAEHHHQADFENLSGRQLATLWKAPVIVTTAVQFFETLGANMPARLRKLHELPGSAVFVDEVHAAAPSYLWPQTWLWLKTWVRDWGGHLVLGSGSLPRFWELPGFTSNSASEKVADLVPPALRYELAKAENRRITPRRRYEPYDCAALIDAVVKTPGPRLVIMNTVQSAAVFADKMRRARHEVLHLSTALAPVHRDHIVERVKERLARGGELPDWTLVATSCVEAGMDFSFRTGFRETCSVASLIQVGGRVNRQGQDENAKVWDFRTQDPILSRHPGFETGRRVVDQFFERKAFEEESPSALAKEAMGRELTEGDRQRAESLRIKERGMEYPEVAKLCRVIDTDSRLVVVDSEIIRQLELGERVAPVQMLRHSVQLRATKIVKLALTNIEGYDEVFKWTGPYDPDFLGYMAGVLPLIYTKETGLLAV